MMEFYSSKEIPEEIIRQSLAPERIEIQVSHTAGDFQYLYQVLVFGNGNLRMRDKVEKLKKLASQAIANLLCDDESIHPYQYIYFQPAQEAFVVGVNEQALDKKNELHIDYFIRDAWGMMCIDSPLTPHQKNEIMANMTPAPIQDITCIDALHVDHDFQKAQMEFQQLSTFRYFYLLYPPEKCPWYSREEKAACLTTWVTQWSDAQQITVCLFPPNHDVVLNIPGGSDSEKFCQIIRGGRSEKIIYKTRRKSW